MYNILIIVCCILIVYGAYALLRELLFLCIREKRFVVAVRLQEGIAEEIADAEYYAQTKMVFEGRPILLCEGDPPKEAHTYGIDVYKKVSRKEVPWQEKRE